MNKMSANKIFRTAIPVILGGLSLACGNIIGAKNHYLSALLLIALAIVLYFYCVFALASRNWMDIRAIFSGVWLGTIGLAALRLTDYQEPWQDKTWLLLGLAYGVFLLGATVGIACGERFFPKMAKKGKGYIMGRFRFQMQNGRLYWICVITTLIGFACFVANVAIRGYIPCFSVNGSNVYHDFYTKFYIFAVAATGISGLCYYCLVKQKNSFVRKLVLLLCIFYSTFAFPILVVSRGTFVTSALSLATVVFYLHRKKLVVLITCLAVIFGVYYASSWLRGYTDAQLQVFFEPTVITMPTASPESTELVGITEPTVTEPTVTDPPASEYPTFQLSPKMAFLYSYLTVSHDNFNEAVQNAVDYTYGIRQLAPFNVILRSEKIANAIAEAEYHLVRQHLNTTNLIGDFYYDLRGIGVVLFTFLWAFVFGMIQNSCDTFKSPFSVMILGNTMTPIVLCFFASWMSIFSHWMHWGTVLVIALAACITKKPVLEETLGNDLEK